MESKTVKFSDIKNHPNLSLRAKDYLDKHEVYRVAGRKNDGEHTGEWILLKEHFESEQIAGTFIGIEMMQFENEDVEYIILKEAEND